MADRVIWNYLEELPEQEAAWREWQSGLSGWHRFNTFYTHYLRVEGRRVKLLNCPSPCEQGYPRQVIENSPSNIVAVCPQNQADPIQLKFRDILIYALRRDIFHQALCVSMQINRPSNNAWREFGSTWYLGDYCDLASKIHCPVYLTYQAAMLPEAISSLCRLHQEPFLLMAPTGHGLTPEAQQLLANNNSVLFSMEAELSLQSDGSFKPGRNIMECMKSRRDGCLQDGQCKTLPIEAYKFLVYNEK